MGLRWMWDQRLSMINTMWLCTTRVHPLNSSSRDILKLILRILKVLVLNYTLVSCRIGLVLIESSTSESLRHSLILRPGLLLHARWAMCIIGNIWNLKTVALALCRYSHATLSTISSLNFVRINLLGIRNGLLWILVAWKSFNPDHTIAKVCLRLHIESVKVGPKFGRSNDGLCLWALIVHLIISHEYSLITGTTVSYIDHDSLFSIFVSSLEIRPWSIFILLWLLKHLLISILPSLLLVFLMLDFRCLKKWRVLLIW